MLWFNCATCSSEGVNVLRHQWWQFEGANIQILTMPRTFYDIITANQDASVNDSVHKMMVQLC